MIRHLFLLILLLLMVEAPTMSATSQTTEPSAVVQPLVDIVADGLSVTWDVPLVEWLVVNSTTQAFIEGYTAVSDPGAYQIPSYSVLIAVPDGAVLSWELTAVTESTHPLPYPFLIAPQAEGVVLDATGEPIGGDFSPATLHSDNVAPLISLQEMGKMRGVRLARLTLHPVRPDGNVALVAQQVQVAVQFNRSQTAVKAAVSFQIPDSDPLIGGLQTIVVNPSHIFPTPKAEVASIRTVVNSDPVAAIGVAERGITAVTYQDLANIGFPVGSVDPDKLHLRRDGVEISIKWDGDADSSFESNERFLFYADPRFSRWMNHDVYLLSSEAVDGERIVDAAAPTNGLPSGRISLEKLVESNVIYMPDALIGDMPTGRDGDRWVWDDLRQPGRPSNSYDINLPTVNNGEAATLTLWMIGFTKANANPDHHVDVSLNGVDLGRVEWDARTAVTATLTISPTILQTSNELTLDMPDEAETGITIDGFWLDAAQISYARGSSAVDNAVQLQGESIQHAYSIQLANTSNVILYDVTTPETPLNLTGMTIGGGAVSFGDVSAGTHDYSVTNQAGVQTPVEMRLRKPLQTESVTGADYIMIAPPEFMSALPSLVALREAQGLTVVVEDVEAIYDMYGNGRSSPDAIYDYLANAYANWTPTPSYVMLVGDATTDPKHYRVDTTNTWVLPFLANVDPWIGEVPADNRYVMLDGADILPDMMIGRLPVNSLTETEAVVDKIIGYETTPTVGKWNSNATFVTDNTEYDYNEIDEKIYVTGAGDFFAHSKLLSNQFIDDNDPLRSNSLLFNPVILEPEFDGFDNGYEYNTSDDISNGLTQSWASGNGLLFFTGHSSIHQWAGERLFHLDDVATLTNNGRLPIIVEMTCFTSSFQLPATETLDEALVRHENGGAVATWGSTGLGVSTGHNALADGFLQTLLIDGNPSVGQATVAGKIEVMAHQPFHRDLIDTFTLLGDPAMQFNMDFTGSKVFLPTISR